MKGKAEKAYKMTPKGEKFFDLLLTFLEENIELAAEGLNEIVEKMAEEGKLPHSCKESVKT